MTCTSDSPGWKSYDWFSVSKLDLKGKLFSGVFLAVALTLRERFST
jgi:hypothetical protein